MRDLFYFLPKKGVFILFVLACINSYAQSKDTVAVKFFPVQDSLYEGMTHVMVIFSPSPKKMQKAVIDISGPALASAIKDKPNYYRLMITGPGLVQISIINKGKELYSKKFKVLPLPGDPAKRDALKEKFRETQLMLKN
jgi:hypothetical protein